jgi:predicted dienelactone hydrolase
MRLAEFFLLASALTLSITILVRGRAHGWLTRAWSVVVLAALVVHIAYEGLYWQVAAAYVACLFLLFAMLAASRWPGMILRVAAGLATLLLLASAAALVVLPKFRLPKPTGPYAVGTQILHFEDPSRPDSAFASGHRELMVQIWYPAENSRAPLAAYRRAAETTWLSSYDSVLATHSRMDAPVIKTSGPLPILLFNPAWQGQRTQNTFQTENLASHGFVVVAIDHTHNSEPIAFPDGKIIASPGIRDIEDFNGVSYQQQLAYGDAEVNRQAKDDSVVLDALVRLNSDASSPWFHALDLNRIGAFGHSFGGSASIQAAFRDPRIAAAMNMDGWIFGDLWQRNFPKPLMLIYEDPYPPPSAVIQSGLKSADRDTRLTMQLNVEDLANVNRTLSACGGYLLSVHGSGHFNFSDRALYSPFRRLTEAGRIRPQLAHSIVNDYTLAFFNEALNGTPAPLLHQASPYPDVHFENLPKQSACETGAVGRPTQQVSGRK